MSFVNETQLYSIISHACDSKQKKYLYRSQHMNHLFILLIALLTCFHVHAFPMHKTIVAVFTAPSCNTCDNSMIPFWKEQALTYVTNETHHVEIVNCDHNKSICDTMNATSLPHISYRIDDEWISYVGSTEHEKIKVFLNTLRASCNPHTLSNCDLEYMDELDLENRMRSDLHTFHLTMTKMSFIMENKLRKYKHALMIQQRRKLEL